MKKKTRDLIRSAILRATRTFLQSFLAIVTASPLLELDVSSLQAAAAAGLAAVLALAQRALDESGVPTIPPG